MIKIFLKEKEPTEIVIKRFKNLVEKSRILNIYKDKLFNKKPSVVRKNKKKSVIKNLQKLYQKRVVIERRLYV